jgi:protein-ribulosamine 3-kinase
MFAKEKPRVLSEELEAAIQRAFDSGVVDAARVTGGDINDAFEVELGNRKKIFVKANAESPDGMFDVEAKGLAWLRATDTLRVPEVLAVAAPEEEVPFLALERIVSGRKRDNWDELLGRGLAALHRTPAPSFGLDHSNFIGRLAQDNGPAETWSEFYITRRLEPQVRLAVNSHEASMTMKSGFARLFARMESRVGDPEPPSHLHGDLWSGNVMTDEAGDPCLVDPAVYGGCREMDLAMMRLFGGFSARVFDVYREEFAPGEGDNERVPLYQLYPLLVHLNLFGGSRYGDQVEAALRKVL